MWRRTVTALAGQVECLVGDTLCDDSLAKMACRILDQAPKRFALSGVSMGGRVTLELIQFAPERISHVALFDTNALPDTPGIEGADVAS